MPLTSTFPEPRLAFLHHLSTDYFGLDLQNDSLERSAILHQGFDVCYSSGNITCKGISASSRQMKHESEQSIGWCNDNKDGCETSIRENGRRKL